MYFTSRTLEEKREEGEEGKRRGRRERMGQRQWLVSYSYMHAAVPDDSHLFTMVDGHMYPVRIIQETAQLITGRIKYVWKGVCVWGGGGGGGGKKATSVAVVCTNKNVDLL